MLASLPGGKNTLARSKNRISSHFTMSKDFAKKLNRAYVPKEGNTLG
jgi:hypothetical protein